MSGRRSRLCGGLGIALPLAILLSGLWHLARTWAWAWCFPKPRQVGFLRLARVRLSAEAFSYLTFGGMVGEPLKVVLLSGSIDARQAAAAVALERFAFLVGTTIIVGVGAVVRDGRPAADSAVVPRLPYVCDRRQRHFPADDCGGARAGHVLSVGVPAH